MFKQFLVVLSLLLLLLGRLIALQVGFYGRSCPSAEVVVRGVIEREVAIDQRNAAILLRLQFHDCFVEGCDASILIKRDGEDGDEIDAPTNVGVGGFVMIDEAKAAVERLCPGVVSCADIIALAARDAVVLAKGPFYEVPTGRRDGRIARLINAANLPDAQDSIGSLRSKFREQGLSDHDLVLLSAGAHTIGLTACFFVTSRLDRNDPSINPEFFKVLREKCPRGGDVGVKIPLDWNGESIFDDHILQNIKRGRGVLASDSVLYRDESTQAIIDSYLAKNSSRKPDFAADFAKSIVKMGMLRVKTGNEGEIRRFCNATN